MSNPAIHDIQLDHIFPMREAGLTGPQIVATLIHQGLKPEDVAYAMHTSGYGVGVAFTSRGGSIFVTDRQVASTDTALEATAVVCDKTIMPFLFQNDDVNAVVASARPLKDAGMDGPAILEAMRSQTKNPVIAANALYLIGFATAEIWDESGFAVFTSATPVSADMDRVILTANSWPRL